MEDYKPQEGDEIAIPGWIILIDKVDDDYVLFRLTDEYDGLIRACKMNTSAWRKAFKIHAKEAVVERIVEGKVEVVYGSH